LTDEETIPEMKWTVEEQAASVNSFFFYLDKQILKIEHLNERGQLILTPIIRDILKHLGKDLSKKLAFSLK